VTGREAAAETEEPVVTEVRGVTEEETEDVVGAEGEATGHPVRGEMTMSTVILGTMIADLPTETLEKATLYVAEA